MVRYDGENIGVAEVLLMSRTPVVVTISIWFQFILFIYLFILFILFNNLHIITLLYKFNYYQ